MPRRYTTAQEEAEPMLNQTLPADLPATIQLTGFICQICTTLIAAVIGLVTFRYTRRQNALTLINQNNSLANLVNSTILQSEQAQQTLGKLHSFVVGCPDDAILFMYLNYVHNTFRTHQIGAVSAHVWRDTLASCVTMMGRLRRDQLEALLSRGYEPAFKRAVLARYDAIALPPPPDAVTTLPQRDTRRLALVG
jgi:hypothetical protein